MTSFDGAISVVTGAASGIGLEIVRQLCAVGAVVVAADLDAERLDDQTRPIVEAGGQLRTQVLDVRDTDALRALIDGAVERHGRIDYLFNIAGIGGVAGEVRDLSPEDWDNMVRVNLMSVIHGSSFAYRHMRAQRSGHIVNMASAAGLMGATDKVAYAVTKTAVVSFSRDLRLEAETFGIKVTALCPGYVESRIFDNARSSVIDLPKAKAQIPVRFLPTDQAVATMLAGVKRNKAIVALPFSIRALWLIGRLFPVLGYEAIGRKLLLDFRLVRLPSAPND
jgi:NAD(P)-dependent dehydrogenase (short-subunit alcohol dehydrogenase family)